MKMGIGHILQTSSSRSTKSKEKNQITLARCEHFHQAYCTIWSKQQQDKKLWCILNVDCIVLHLFDRDNQYPLVTNRCQITLFSTATYRAYFHTALLGRAIIILCIFNAHYCRLCPTSTERICSWAWNVYVNACRKYYLDKQELLQLWAQRNDIVQFEGSSQRLQLSWQGNANILPGRTCNITTKHAQLELEGAGKVHGGPSIWAKVVLPVTRMLI